ncbi:beta-lactamase family protein [Nocardia sp. NBC_01499]|uniref:serine hydrolase domain-containing protein n=1 Tax=Nocardia sp. NBC_01499 TaxID=2903597 RepID=UPI003867956F
MKRVALVVMLVAVVLNFASGPAFAGGLNTDALDRAVRIPPGDNAAGELALVGTPEQTWSGSVGDLHSGRPVSPNAHYRIGSVSKLFEAVIVLQLAAEGRVCLDAPVQLYLPEALPLTFAPITVRQLLNHTSGLPGEDEGAPAPTADYFVEHRYDYQTFAQIVDSTLRPHGRAWPGPHFAPGTKQEYSSFAYRVAGLLIERVTGHSFADEVHRRITDPLGLTETSVPDRDPALPAPALIGYVTTTDGKVVDIADQSGLPSSMISTSADIDRFFVAMMRGDLLPAAQQRELFAIPRDASGALLCDVKTAPPGTQCFGSGPMTTRLGDGNVLWGKTGHDLGYASGVFATPDLRLHGVYAVGRITLDNGDAPALALRIAQAATQGTPPH